MQSGSHPPCCFLGSASQRKDFDRLRHIAFRQNRLRADSYGGGGGSTLANIVWVVLVGWFMAFGYLCAGVANCATIVGIPFGVQSFKMAKLALWPFGADIVSL